MSPPASKAPGSLVTRLSRALVLWVSGLWLMTALGTTWYVRTEVNDVYDSALSESAWRLLDLVNHELAEHGAGLVLGNAPPQRSSDFPLHIEPHHLIYQITSPDGTLLLRSNDAPDQVLAPDVRYGFTEQGDWRVFSLTHPDSQARIHVADARGHRRHTQIDIVLSLMLPLLGLLPVLALMIRHITRRELASVATLADQIRERSDRNLSPLSSAGLPAELLLITERSNHLLQRLAGALDTERALAANAAHELRTPLATTQLRLQGLQDLIGQQPDAVLRQELQKAQDALAQLSRRAEKLLQMSRAESGATLAREPVALSPLAAAVAQEFWLDPAMMDRLQLQVPEHGDAVALGDADALAIVLRNLLENAVRYAPHGPIVLRVALPARLSVSDQGPGMAPDRQAELLQRHQQGHADPGTPAPTAGARHPPQPGYGLGLSIVSTIVERQGGQISLHSPAPGRAAGPNPGLEVRLDLPPAPPPSAPSHGAPA
ncbi:sensor histidine kinase N-terminal domain-containing protein [Curvibacter sp. HBC61]|uniref:histidine kinase n=1 Tax=Curvibacter cyanobacteriorum TaxID=3026422 RepID=A0ABT5MZT3_9BURK|nr:ATP-binding protein [Curvibacter sp. HBC61]MDD0839564.1 sensor histidine kinase N-terminal domain-containing protein [Curvibacter sp. HBC61]